MGRVAGVVMSGWCGALGLVGSCRWGGHGGLVWHIWVGRVGSLGWSWRAGVAHLGWSGRVAGVVMAGWGGALGLVGSCRWGGLSRLSWPSGRVVVAFDGGR